MPDSNRYFKIPEDRADDILRLCAEARREINRHSQNGILCPEAGSHGGYAVVETRHRRDAYLLGGVLSGLGIPIEEIEKPHRRG